MRSNEFLGTVKQMGAIISFSGRLLRGGLIVGALIAFIATFAGHDTADASSFNPSYSLSFANDTPGASSDITTTIFIDAPDANIGPVIGFTPPDWGVARDAEVPDGALVGVLDTIAILGC